MDVFMQKKCLIRTIVGLATCNLILMSFFMWQTFASGSPPIPAKKHRDVATLLTILQNELHLTSEQVEQVKTLRAEYFNKEKELLEVIGGKRDSMNVEMFQKTTDSVLITALSERLAENKVQLELLRYEQSKTFKTICTPEQLDKFGSLIKEIRAYFKSATDLQKK
jgi:Spy/CpxP family protein refolding chaperone